MIYPTSGYNTTKRSLTVFYIGCPMWTYKLIEGEIKKPPIDLHTGRQASVTRPETWGSFQDAQRAYETGQISGKPVTLAGVGFVLTHGIVGIDIDHCIQNGTISADTSL